MRLLVDGYNFLHFVERKLDLPSGLEARRDWLVKRLQEHAVHKKLKITVVFDGQDQSRDRYGAIEILYTPGKGSADRAIIRMCQEEPGQFIVVSDDREVRSGAKSMSCLDVPCEDFFKKINAPLNFLDDDSPIQKDDGGPIYKTVSTKKKGNARKLSKAERKRQQSLKKL